ncbi:MAG: fimbrial protein [Serratia sp. (in: enterobacteria)]|uniref:fimbrial protein n=1 Tax=Serratia sp. (in: enterobacteria) TaxID=616 RepID=UPI003F30D801
MQQIMRVISGKSSQHQPGNDRGMRLSSLSLLMTSLLVLSGTAIADAGRNSAERNLSTSERFVEGNEGILHVYGALTESACRLDMTSANQVVEMGVIGTGRLQSVGAEGTPVAVNLILRDCLRVSSYNLDERQGNVVWAEDQPSMSITFLAPQDIYDSKMIGVRGAQGLALRLSDSEQHPVPLGQRNRPVLLNPGNNVLNYWLTPVRTAAPLQAGAYTANVDFRLSYD